MYYLIINSIGCLTDMGKVDDRGGLGQGKLGDSDHLCNLHNLPDTNAGSQCSTAEVPLLQKATNTHPFPVDSCEFLLIYVCVVATTNNA